MAGTILTLDCGLTGCKALAFDATGAIIAGAAEKTPVRHPRSGLSEMAMDGLRDCAFRLLGKVCRQLPAGSEQIVAVGVSGHGNGLYPVGENGALIGPAITSMDRRAEGAFRSLGGSEQQALVDLTAQQLWSGQPGMILRHLKQQEPTRYGQIRNILFCKDYLSTCLTGTVGTDYSDLSAGGLLSAADDHASANIMELLGIPEMASALPPLRRGDRIAGEVSASASERTGIPVGTPVIGGLFDVDACMYGCGVVEPQQIGSIAGTWNVNARPTDKVAVDKQIRQTIRRTDGVQALRIDSSATSAINLEWLLGSLFGGTVDLPTCDRLLGEAEITLRSPHYLPFINGSLGAVQEGASFSGLDLSSGQREIIAAVCEGIACAHRVHLDHLGGPKDGSLAVTLTGGMAKSAPFCQLLADVTGRVVRTSNTEQSGARGVWLAARVALEMEESLSQAVAAHCAIDSEFEPDCRRIDLFQERYDKFVSTITTRKSSEPQGK